MMPSGRFEHRAGVRLIFRSLAWAFPVFRVPEESFCLLFAPPLKFFVPRLRELVSDVARLLDIAFEVAIYKEKVDARGGAPRERIDHSREFRMNVVAGWLKSFACCAYVEAMLFVLVKATKSLVPELC